MSSTLSVYGNFPINKNDLDKIMVGKILVGKNPVGEILMGKIP